MNIMQIIACSCSAIAAACTALFFFDLVRSIEKEKNEVLDEYKRIPIFFRILMPFVPNILPGLHNDTMKKICTRAQEKIVMAGYDLALTGEQFIALRILFAIVGLIFGLLFFIGGQRANALLFLMITVIYPDVWLNNIIKKRHLEILKSLPNMLDLLTLSVEAGKDFLSALRDILQRRKMDALGTEFLRTLHEIQLGKSRPEAMKQMSQRVQQPDLSTVLNAIVQADELGVSIGALLRVQGDQLRAKRFSRAEKLANEAPVKILFPIIVFIFPCVFLVLLGPLAAQAMSSFGF